ncbi:MAG: hypothetical protein M1832_001365 [Thelocarpon impressellum]|nr:MAG: hypothetical protein M1832_001365 [Thelocarpon impressellum]
MDVDSDDDVHGESDGDVGVQAHDADPLAPDSASKLQLPDSCEPPGRIAPRRKVWVVSVQRLSISTSLTAQVFGATGHMGRSLIRKALDQGDLVTAVGRLRHTQPAEMEGWDKHGNCLATLCDVRIPSTVSDVFSKSLGLWQRIDVVVNCAGYGVIAACEDQDEAELRDQFETNFWGTLNILQLSLPYFRSQRGGRYLIFSSTSGALGVPGLGPYCATKYAVEGLIESMLYEVDAFGIKATLVEPGMARRDEPDATLPTYGHFLMKPASAAYDAPDAPAGHARRMIAYVGDRQPVSAVKCAELVWQLGHCSYPPLRLLLGSYAVESIRDRLKSIIEEIEDWKHLSFPIAGPSAADGEAQAEAETGEVGVSR